MEDKIAMIVALVVLGLVAGSFAGASVWRLRSRQLREDEDAGEKVTKHDKREVQKLHKVSLLQDRSVCLHCGHVLKWYDLIPLVSWLSQRGKCRYCHKSIGWFEPAIELGVAVFFVMSYIFWPTALTSPLEVTHFVVWLVSGMGLSILFAYDAKWFLLPNVVVLPLMGLGFVNSIIVVTEYHSAWLAVMNILVGCVVLSGTYYLIYVLSRHQWVGFGDVKLGLVLALLLADWQLAILALFLANLIGTIVILPMMLSGKVKRQAHIPFGPLLIGGYFIAGLFGTQIIAQYLSISLGAV